MSGRIVATATHERQPEPDAGPWLPIGRDVLTGAIAERSVHGIRPSLISQVPSSVAERP
jgi:hypothetical protein